MMPGGKPVTLIALPEDNFFKLVPPLGVNLVKETTTQFQINYLTGGTNYLDDTCMAWPAQAQAAFNYAASIWASNLQSSVPITINACWATSLPTRVLGHSIPRYFFRNFSGAPVSSTWYPVSLANALAGTDLDTSAPDMEMAFSSTFNWYLGTDGNPGSGKYDFVSVVMHEIGHGLGFLGLMSVQSGQGSWGSGTGSPFVYDRFTENGSGQTLINTSIFPNPSVALAAQLTGGNLYFDGAKASAANGGARVKIYSPSTWVQGSSYAHLDFDTFNNTANALMVYAIGAGEARHLSGPVILGFFQDEGWNTSGGSACSLSAPTPIFPSGSVSPTPTYTWTAVAGAEQYQLWVDDSSAAGKIRAWYTAAEAGCSSGSETCSVTPAVSLASGPAQFSVRAWASCDGGIYSSWSDSMRFSIGGGGENFITQVLGLYPVNNATPGGTAVLAAQVQNNFSAAMPANAAVSFHVFGTGIDTIVGSTSISGLTPGNMNVYSYSWTIPSSLSPGVYSYRARVFIGITAISEWSSWQGFTINSGGGGGYAAQVTQILPVDDAVVGGSVTLGAEVVNTGSLALPSDATVRFWVSGLSDNWVGSASVAGLAAGARGVHSFIWHIPASLPPGTYTYYAQVFRGLTTPISEWSSGQEVLIRSGYFRAQVMQLSPVADTVAGTSAALRADVKNTGSLPLPSNAAVWFWVSGLSNSWVGSAPAAGLGAGSDSWYGFIWKTPADLTPGAYTLYAQVWTDVAISEWNSGLSFNITGGGLPGKATLISPAGSSASSSPTYGWNAVSNAAWYYLWVSDSSSGQRITAWYTADQAGCASGSGVCSVTPALTLAQGACQWWIQTWNEAGYGPWSDAMSFTVESGVTPGAAILVSPTGTITTATPAYTWYAVQGSTWYLLWVNDSAGSGKINKWYTADQAGCLSGFGTCSVQPDTPLAQGAAQWWVQTWFSSGAGPWSDGMSFAVGNAGFRN